MHSTYRVCIGSPTQMCLTTVDLSWIKVDMTATVLANSSTTNSGASGDQRNANDEKWNIHNISQYVTIYNNISQYMLFTDWVNWFKFKLGLDNIEKITVGEMQRHWRTKPKHIPTGPQAHQIFVFPPGNGDGGIAKLLNTGVTWITHQARYVILIDVWPIRQPQHESSAQNAVCRPKLKPPNAPGEQNLVSKMERRVAMTSASARLGVLWMFRSYQTLPNPWCSSQVPNLISTASPFFPS